MRRFDPHAIRHGGAKQHLATELFERAGREKQPDWRRQQPRRDIREAVYIEVAGEPEPLFGYTIDVTPDAIGVSCKQAIASGSDVRIRLADEERAPWSKAHVIHCTQAISGYKIGLSCIP